MKFFLDTANMDEISEANSLGMVDGVTTNPSLIAREKGDIVSIIANICKIIDGPVSAEVISLDVSGMLKEAKTLSKISDNVVIKLPMTVNGLKVARQLSSENIKTNLTLIFSPLQALMAAKAGASYVSPFLGRLDDLSHRGTNLVDKIIKIYSNYGYNTEVIVASIRNPLHILDSAILGADIATIPLSVLKKIVKHPLTDTGLASFLSDWQKSKN